MAVVACLWPLVSFAWTTLLMALLWVDAVTTLTCTTVVVAFLLRTASFELGLVYSHPVDSVAQALDYSIVDTFVDTVNRILQRGLLQELYYCSTALALLDLSR
jgi:hypothetical protein